MMSGESTNLSTASIHSLPKNILVNVFSYFKEEELIKSVSNVCFKWKIAASDSSLWKSIKFEGDSVSLQEMTNILRKATLLESLTLISVPEIIRIIRHISRCNTKLKDFSVKNYVTEDMWLPENVLINMLLSCTDLESITIKGLDFSSSRFFELLATKSSIKSVNIGLNNSLTINEIMLLAHNCQQLEVLKLSPCSTKNPLTDQNVEKVLGFLKTTLISLKLDVTYLGKLTYNAILNCTKLRELNLKNAISLTGYFFQEMLSRLMCLRILKIHSATLLTNNDFLTGFSTKNDILKKLEILKINDCRLNDASLIQVLSCCHLTLKQLDLLSCKSITSDICTAVKRCRNLTFLNLAFTTVSTKCWINIIQSLSNLSKIIMDITVDKSLLLSQINLSTMNLEIIIMENEFNKKKEHII